MSVSVSKVAVLEAEAGQLRTQASQHKNHVKTLERRIENLVMEVNDANEKTKQVLDDQNKLVAEKNALIQTVKKLNRDVAKLESFKRHLLQTLQVSALCPSFVACEQRNEEERSRCPGGFPWWICV